MSLLPRVDAFPLADRNQIDAICLAFEDEWLTGRRPVLEAYLGRIDAACQSLLLQELLLLELDYRRSIRDEPTLDDYLARFAAVRGQRTGGLHGVALAGCSAAAPAGQPDWPLSRPAHAGRGRFRVGLPGLGRAAAAGSGGEGAPPCPPG